jgi:hypothetical protein
MFWLEEI